MPQKRGRSKKAEGEEYGESHDQRNSDSDSENYGGEQRMQDEDHSNGEPESKKTRVDDEDEYVDEANLTEEQRMELLERRMIKEQKEKEQGRYKEVKGK